MKRDARPPHGYVNGRDLSGSSGRSASGDPASSLPEEMLVRGYRGLRPETRVETCVCGGEIESLDEPNAIRYAVEAHNESTVHLQWRAWRE